jgi:hypothetical protein
METPMKKFKMVWHGGSFEPRNADVLWDLYNTDPNIQTQVDALYESTGCVKTTDTFTPNRVVWACEDKNNPEYAHRMVWEIRQCGYCHKSVVANGYTINQGFYSHMCKSCKEAGFTPAL